MKIKVIKQFEVEIFEVSELTEDSVPPNYEKPYFIVADSMEDITVSFQFLAREEILRKSGKRKYFDKDLCNAQELNSFSYAIVVANKFKNNGYNPGQKFYVVGSEQARIIQMHNEINHKKNMDTINKLIHKNK